MIRLWRGSVLEARADRPGVSELTVERDGALIRAIAYTDLVGEPAAGDVVLVNVTALELGLGTGGFGIVTAIEGREFSSGTAGHAMKARYMPHQIAVNAHEEGTETAAELSGLPVICIPLHSSLLPVVLGARILEGGKERALSVAYLMTDQASLPIAFSKQVNDLKQSGLISMTITAGQSFGGDHETINVHSGLLAAKELGADVIVVGPGPGHIGTASRYGFAGMDIPGNLLASQTLGGTAILSPRMSQSDARSRHRGLSHHSRTVLEHGPPGVKVPLPAGPRWDQAASQIEAIAEVERIDANFVEILGRHSPKLESMGRGFSEDPMPFETAAAAGVSAAVIRLESRT